MLIYDNEKFTILLSIPFNEIDVNMDYSWNTMKLLFEDIYKDLFNN